MIARDDPWGEFSPAAPEDAFLSAEKRDRARDPWAEFKPAAPSRRAVPGGTGLGVPNGQAHDGDTFRLTSGQNARMYGYDAFELSQQGRSPAGVSVPLGVQSRDALIPYLTPNASVREAARPSYNRPVVGLDAGGVDPAVPLLRQGMGMAAPEYLKGDPQRLAAYMEAERFARQNRAGAFGNTFSTPKAARSGKGEPWSAPDARAGGEAVFFDDPTPLQGLRPDIEAGYLQLTNDRASTPDQILAYAKANGFSVDPDTVRKFVRDRNKGVPVADGVTYNKPPRVLTNLDDGRTGATLRGVADPINMLDEMGAVVDSLGGTPGRESLWNSDRRFGDILHNNLDQNRSIIANDEAEYPWYRFGGQLAGGLVAPGASIEGIGMAAARNALRSGSSRIAARAAAGRAVTGRLATVGAVEGGLAGVGQGETARERYLGGLIGAPAGATLGTAVGLGAPKLRGMFGRMLRREGAEAPADPAAHQYVNGASDTLQADVEDYAIGNARNPAGPLMAFETAAPGATLAGPRVIDRIDVAPNYRPLTSDLTSVDRIRAAEAIEPRDVMPLPSNTVDGLDEAMRIEAGRIAPVRAPNEMDELGRRSIPSPVDGSRTLPKRGPLDLVTWLRTQGGIKAQSGELAHAGIDNAPRKGLDFAGGEGRFGRLVSDDGMPYDEAAMRAWEAGFFPGHAERPTPAEFLDALRETHAGRNRAFRLDDEDEIARFEAARDQRFAVEGARERGAPLVNDRGQPVNMGDLDANAPPVQAYEEWGENAPNLAGNIRLDKLDSPQAIKRALSQVDRVSGGFDGARRGRIAQAETASLAADLNMTPRQLLSRRKGEAFNAEQALAARQILAKSGNELVNMARRIQGGVASDREKLAWREALIRHSAIQEQVSGITAEAGRALSAMRMTADSRAVSGSVLREVLENFNGSNSIDDAAAAIIDSADSPQRLNSMVRTLTKPSMKDKALSLMYFSQLSSPVTHAVNVMSNTMTSLAQLPEMAVTAGVGRMRTMMPGAVSDRVLFSEVGQRAVGWLAGAKEGFANMARTLRTGETSDAFAKFETSPNQRAFSGPLGLVVEAPMRALSAEDELFKAMARHMDIRGLAMRAAKLDEGLSGQAARDRAADLAANPTPEMMEQAFDYARYVTFQRPLGDTGRRGMAFLNSKWGAGFRVFIPYVKTPTNLLKFAAERSPVAPALWRWHRDFQAGGAKRDAAIARWMVGSGATMMALEAAQQGHITGGGPSDPKKRALLLADGWQPYSVRIGDTYYSYRRLDPFSTTIGFAADYVDLQDNMSEKERDEIGSILAGSALQNLSSKTWLSGMTNLGEALGDWGRYGEGFLASLAGNAVPGFAAAGARTIDPIQREAGDWLSRIRSRVPYYSRSLPPRRDVLGQPVIGFNGGGLAALSPIVSSTRRNDPTINGLLAAGIGLTKPGKSVSDPNNPGEKVTLSPEQFSEYQRLSGQQLRPGLSALVADPWWPQMSSDDREKAVGDLVKAARKEGRRGLFGRPLAEMTDPWAEFTAAR